MSGQQLPGVDTAAGVMLFIAAAGVLVAGRCMVETTAPHLDWEDRAMLAAAALCTLLLVIAGMQIAEPALLPAIVDTVRAPLHTLGLVS